MNHKRIRALLVLFLAIVLWSGQILADEPTPGALVQIYDIQENMEKIYPLSAGQFPNVARVVPTIDLRGERGDFRPFTKKFMTVVTADLEIKEAGAYGFRLSSDDGSILYIDDDQVIDHDGLHGPDPAKEATRDLVSGKYKLRIEHFEYGGGEQVTLHWKPPGGTVFSLIPASALTISEDADRSTAPGKKEILRPPARPRPGDGMPLAGVHPSFDYLTLDRQPHPPALAVETPDPFPPRLHPGGRDPNARGIPEPRITGYAFMMGSTYHQQLLLGDRWQRRGLHRGFSDRESETGDYSGALRFSQGFDKPVRNIRIQDDSSILLGSTPTQSTRNGDFDLGMLVPNGRMTFEIRRARAFSNGIDLEFTEPMATHCGAEPEYYYVLYRPVLDPDVIEIVEINRVTVTEERERVFLEFPLRDGFLYVRLLGDLISASGEKLWSTELWFRANDGPHPTFDAFNPPPPPKPTNILTHAERATGWRLLFDGKTTKGWRSFRKSTFPEKGWAIEDGCLTVTGDGGGDIITEDQFDSFELSLEWKVSPSGNSGIFWHVTEDGRWVWETGPEMQVLDNSRHPDGRSMFTSAGSNYALHAPSEDDTKPVGLFNEARILVDGNHVEYHLNGHKQCAFELGSEAFKKLVAGSKFKDMPMFAKKSKGHIALQDHGDKVWYRNIKIRPVRSTSE